MYEPLTVPQLIDGIFNKILSTDLAKNLVSEDDLDHFLKIAKDEIAALHEGNFARYRLRPGEFLLGKNGRHSDVRLITGFGSG